MEWQKANNDADNSPGWSMTNYIRLKFKVNEYTPISSLLFLNAGGTADTDRGILKTSLGNSDGSVVTYCNGGLEHSNDGVVNCEVGLAEYLHIYWFPLAGGTNRIKLCEIYALE